MIATTRSTARCSDAQLSPAFSTLNMPLKFRVAKNLFVPGIVVLTCHGYSCLPMCSRLISAQHGSMLTQQHLKTLGCKNAFCPSIQLIRLSMVDSLRSPAG